MRIWRDPVSKDAHYQSALDTAAEVRNKVNTLHVKAVTAATMDEDSTIEDARIVVAFTDQVHRALDDLTKFLANKRSKARKNG